MAILLCKLQCSTAMATVKPPKNIILVSCKVNAEVNDFSQHNICILIRVN